MIRSKVIFLVILSLVVTLPSYSTGNGKNVHSSTTRSNGYTSHSYGAAGSRGNNTGHNTGTSNHYLSSSYSHTTTSKYGSTGQKGASHSTAKPSGSYYSHSTTNSSLHNPGPSYSQTNKTTAKTPTPAAPTPKPKPKPQTDFKPASPIYVPVQ